MVISHTVWYFVMAATRTNTGRRKHKDPEEERPVTRPQATTESTQKTCLTQQVLEGHCATIQLPERKRRSLQFPGPCSEKPGSRYPLSFTYELLGYSVASCNVWSFQLADLSHSSNCQAYSFICLLAHHEQEFSSDKSQCLPCP